MVQVKLLTNKDLPTIDYRELKPLKKQGIECQMDLEGLSKSIQESKGWTGVFNVVNINNEYYITDGNGRYAYLVENDIINEDRNYLFPYIETKIPDEVEDKLEYAKRVLLSKEYVFNKWISEDALLGFVPEFNDFEMFDQFQVEFSLNDIGVDDEDFEKIPQAEEKEAGEVEPEKKILKLEYSADEYTLVKEALGNRGETAEKVLFDALCLEVI